MRFKARDQNGKLYYKVVTWSEHTHECARCAKVIIDKSATFTEACPIGSELLMERLVTEQAPVQQAKAREVEEWARKAGVFKIK